MRKLRVHDEAHGHRALLAGFERLRREAEAFGLVEIERGLGWRNVRDGLRRRVPACEVLRDELRLVELAGMNFHRAHYGAELPIAHRGKLRQEVHGDEAIGVGLLFYR